MATGQEVLAHYQITIDQAQQFILANIKQPDVIFDTAEDFGITTQHLSDITGYSTNIISGFFGSFGLDTVELDDIRILFNSELDNGFSLVGFNNRSDVLSTASLSSLVKADVEISDYSDFFKPVFSYQTDDGLYTPDELGVPGNSVPATEASIESLVYGTLINVYAGLDDSELTVLKDFSHNAANIDEYRALLTDALGDPAIHSDEELADLIADETVALINEFWYGDVIVNGTLDLSLLGLAGIA